MSRDQLGEFEEIVLLTVAILQEGAYGLAIVQEMESRLNRRVSIGSLQTVLRRLEDKRFLTSAFGEATKMRGGKRKRIFTLTGAGIQILRATKEQRLGLWNAIPDTLLST